MSKFTITLPNNMHAAVYKGKVIKKSAKFPDILMPWKRLSREERTGYIVKLDNNSEYHLLRTTEGTWPHEETGLPDTGIKKEGKWIQSGDTEITLAMKQAIDNYENGKSAGA